MGEPIYLHAWTQLDIPVERVLDGAKGCMQVLVLGDGPDGGLYAASSTADFAAILVWIERFKHRLMSGDYE